VLSGPRVAPTRSPALPPSEPVTTSPPAAPLRVLVATVVHVPADARIARREIGALLAAGAKVTYAAPFAATGTTPPPGVRALELPRSQGRHRLGAILAARRLLREEAPHHDVVLLHDPELLLAAPRRSGAVVAWDVHEDTAAALSLKGWLPSVLRAPVAATVRAGEGYAERHFHLLLAEDGYQVRFQRRHPIVPNSTPAPDQIEPAGDDRVVYVGHLSLARGAAELAEVGRLLQGTGVQLHVVGHADTAATELLTAAQDHKHLVWHGFIPNAEALKILDGALAGLSLLHDEPNYRHSRPTKILEYMAHGVPVVTTPTPPAVELVEGSSGGLIIDFGSPSEVATAAAAAVLRLRDDPELRARAAAGGRAAAVRDHDWRTDGPKFVQVLERWSAARQQ
jgi:glycosyltransferase involved in cell wall biosynthesis